VNLPRLGFRPDLKPSAPITSRAASHGLQIAYFVFAAL
jgi:hypothetical protein